MSRRKLVVRRLQQLFIVASIVGLAPVIACSSEWGFSLRNDLTEDIELRVNPLDDENSRLGWATRMDAASPVTITSLNTYEENRIPRDPGDYDRLGVVLRSEDFNHYFWVKTDAILDTRCELVITDILIEYLNLYPTSREEFSEDTITVNEAILLNPYYQDNPKRRC
ncbi:hypothetical protein [Candidatus Lucifugimonas marina]|uniref:Uncharacterized protein n=1 Tax=Candidatus Lucifugimonas marina TaxID=3038979 RepID=A0AAJ5ZHM5_9CHLR|nr:hypothetical protein [SAR202 cluster bacterium JH702]MDG0869606.1 hypothetical protein [SAR202 cluster bacterium JH639]WFG34339.1 hypothetical protein GKN94_01120 [SAR202 cluster bacterium JH545]WFG38268.1 hypothetical protein GKO48_01135 [SAR202 cluster bacterium JH1073]